MICNNCKAEIENGSEFCNHCGAPVTAGEPVSERQPVTYNEQDIAAEADCPSPIKVLIFGIIGLALSFDYTIPGIILSAIGLKFANDYIACLGNTNTKVKVGRILSIVGLIRSIVLTVLIFIYVGIILLFYGAMILTALAESGINF